MKLQTLQDIKEDMKMYGIDEDRMNVIEYDNELIIDYGGTDNLEFVIKVLADFFSVDIQKYYERFDYENFLLFVIDTGMETVKLSFKY